MILRSIKVNATYPMCSVFDPRVVAEAQNLRKQNEAVKMCRDGTISMLHLAMALGYKRRRFGLFDDRSRDICGTPMHPSYRRREEEREKEGVTIRPFSSHQITTRMALFRQRTSGHNF